MHDGIDEAYGAVQCVLAACFVESPPSFCVGSSDESLLRLGELGHLVRVAALVAVDGFWEFDAEFVEQLGVIRVDVGHDVVRSLSVRDPKNGRAESSWCLRQASRRTTITTIRTAVTVGSPSF